MEGKGKKVCVTGASGYIASWIVKTLLHRGYTVHATLRNPNDPKKTEHLLVLDGAKERLHLFEASLNVEGSFDSAINGCHGVFHTASPTQLHTPNPQLDVIETAVKGTLNVLNSCAKHPTVKRVIFTSSMAAVMFTGKPVNDQVVVDETWVSIPEICEKLDHMKWYVLSKTIAEKEAWKFCKENGIDMLSMNPGFVIGPVLQPTLTSSLDNHFFRLINGSDTYQNLTFGWINVKDVADAHVIAFETPSANGRYLLNESVAHFSDIVDILRQLYPTLTLPTKCDSDEPFAPTYKISKDKVEGLGIKLMPLKASLQETIECLKEKNFISF